MMYSVSVQCVLMFLSLVSLEKYFIQQHLFVVYAPKIFKVNKEMFCGTDQ